MASPALRPSVRLQQRVASVRDFRKAFKDLIARSVLYDAPLGRGFYGPAAGDESLFEGQMDELGMLSGTAVASAGEVRAGVTRYGQSYSPMMQWRDPCRPDGGMASVTDVIDACDTILGILETRLSEAKANERTFAFRLGWLLSFPQRARESAGPSPVAQGLAFWGSLFVGILGVSHCLWRRDPDRNGGNAQMTESSPAGERVAIVTITSQELHAVTLGAQGLGLRSGEWGIEIIHRLGAAKEIKVIVDR